MDPNLIHSHLTKHGPATPYELLKNMRLPQGMLSDVNRALAELTKRNAVQSGADGRIVALVRPGDPGARRR